MKFTRIPENTFKQIQMNAGVLVTNFDPSTQEYSGLLGATTGGITFNATPTFEDFGDDIDNCPKNTLELKKLTEWAVSLSGTFVTITANTAKMLVGAGVIDANNATKIVPRNDVLTTDFDDIWWIGDYSEVNTGANAGFCAVHMLNALNTGGFQIKSTDKGKGNFAFTFEGHYSMSAQDIVPFEVYIKDSGAGDLPYINLNKHSLSIGINEEVQLTWDVNPSDATVSFSSSASGKASVTAGGKIKGLEAGNTIITASFTDDGATYNDTCTVVVTEG